MRMSIGCHKISGLSKLHSTKYAVAFNNAYYPLGHIQCFISCESPQGSSIFMFVGKWQDDLVARTAGLLTPR